MEQTKANARLAGTRPQGLVAKEPPRAQAPGPASAETITMLKGLAEDLLTEEPGSAS